MMPAPADVTPEVLQPLWNDRSLLVRQIGERLGVSQQTISRAAKRFGFLPRKGGAPLPQNNPKVEPGPTEEAVQLPQKSPLEPTPRFSEERDLRLMATKGRYGPLADLCAEWNLPIVAVKQRWHQLASKLPLGYAP